MLTFSVRPVMGAILRKCTGFNYLSCRLKSSSDMGAFQELVKKARHIAAITGAGISAESGVPTYRGAGALWRTYHAQELDTAGVFSQDPSLVWEFYHFRRELVLSKQPNKAHVALAKYENYMEENGRKLTLITQNIDGLHQRAGSKDVTELHGSIFKTRCTSCGYIAVNMDNPICSALAGKGSADMKATAAKIPESKLPRCSRPGCGSLLRPHIVWFGETLDPDVLHYADEALEDCDLCLVIGTSSVVYPAAMFAPRVAQKGVPVAEFNLEETAASYNFQFHFEGPCGTTVPAALAID